MFHVVAGLAMPVSPALEAGKTTSCLQGSVGTVGQGPRKHDLTKSLCISKKGRASPEPSEGQGQEGFCMPLDLWKACLCESEEEEAGLTLELKCGG